MIVVQGKKAAVFVKSVIREGDYITLEFDIQERDEYGILFVKNDNESFYG